MKDSLILPKSVIFTIIKMAIIMTIFLFIPVVQFIALSIAVPLFLIPSISQSSSLMEYTFGYIYPNSPIAIIIFLVYYVSFFYTIELEDKKDKETKIYKSLPFLFLLFVATCIVIFQLLLKIIN